ncbi:MAG TPA: hypothetical protein VFX64_02310 [Candidatus Nitrosotalea sp.]|nr:hypothetical protein [Candidatus Nitrosotalea sp.]
MLATKYQTTSRESRIFAQKVARSIIEVQPNVNNTADIVVLLECLGYRKETLMQYGFADFHALANHIYDSLDMYETRGKSKEMFIESFTMRIPSIQKRLVEGIGMIFPWLGSLALLFITGVSLWMAWGLPIQITTAFVSGVFLGLVITEGTLQVFNRLFLFYNAQTNMGEVKRLQKRSYYLVGIVLSAVVCALFAIGYVAEIPLNLIGIVAISTVTVSLHRASYMIIYALKKLVQLIVAYTAAFASLLLVYYFGQPLIFDNVTRYFAGLLTAFVALSVFSIYQHHKLLKANTKTITGDKPHFYNPISRTDKTIKSRFGIQLWEVTSYSLYGTFYLVTMFADRILSWIYNPLVVSKGFGLPMAFNSVYHAGADLALVVLLPASIIQYVMMEPIHMHMNNVSIKIKVSQANEIGKYIQNTYRKLFLITMFVSITTAIILNLAAPYVMSHVEFSKTSMHVLQVASVANVFLSLFTANSLFLMFTNKIKLLAIIVMISSLIVIVGGVLLASSGFENLIFAYLGATMFAGLISTIYANKVVKNASSILFARLM